MEISRRSFLNTTAATVIGGAAATIMSTQANASVADPAGPVVLPPLPPETTAPAAPPQAVAPPLPAAVAPVSAEGSSLAAAAIASAGYPLSPGDSSEVATQLTAYPTSVKDLRAYRLSNSDAPSISPTPAVHNDSDKTVLGIKI